MTHINSNSDLCVCCGKSVPEGRMICGLCEKVNNRSAANWLVRQLAVQKPPEEKGKDGK